MSARAAERERGAPLEPADACEIGDPDMPEGHRGHHQHVEGNAFVCSCGNGIFGVFSIMLPDWTAEQFDAYHESISCSVCGAKGVIAAQDFGQ